MADDPDKAARFGAAILAEFSADLHGGNPDARFRAALALARIRYAGPVEADLAAVAGEALAALGTQVLPLILPLFSRPDQSERMFAAWTIHHLGERATICVGEVAAHLEKSPCEVTLALVSIGEAAASSLLRALVHPNREVRVAALRAIETPLTWPPKVGERISAALLRFLGDSDAEVSRLAAMAIESVCCSGEEEVRFFQNQIASLEPASKALLREVLKQVKD